MKYKYWMAAVTGIGNATKRKLIEYFGGARGVYEADIIAMIQSGLVKEDIAEYIMRQKELWSLEDEYEKFLENEIGFSTIEDRSYPSLLRTIHNAPYALYYKGTLPGAKETLIAMVGARKASAYGKTMAYEIAKALSRAGYGIVSGMALGIDGESHRGAIDQGGRTYAFLGCGVDVIYPRNHDKLYRQIIENGAVISDFAPHTTPLPEYFPVRNRLISGISKKTLVIEARKKSGSLITADLAMEQGRDVLALPGRISDVMSEGTNQLIAQGAGIITGIDAIIADLTDLGGLENIDAKGCSAYQFNLEKDELLVYSCFDFYSKGLEQVQMECGMELVPLMSIVIRLCELGLIRETFRNRYIRLG